MGSPLPLLSVIQTQDHRKPQRTWSMLRTLLGTSAGLDCLLRPPGVAWMYPSRCLPGAALLVSDTHVPRITSPPQKPPS